MKLRSLLYVSGLFVTVAAIAQPTMKHKPIEFKPIVKHKVFRVVVDGTLDSEEWKAAGVVQYNFGIATCYCRLLNDSFFIAVDVAVDTYNDGDADRLSLFVDVNGNGTIDNNEQTGLQDISAGNKTILLKYYPLQNSIRNAVVATAYGGSAFITNYAHRSWEIAFPINQFSPLKNPGFAFTIISAIPLMNTTIGSEGKDQYSVRFQNENGTLAISRVVIENTGMVNTTNGENLVVGKKILDGGGIETTYSDGSKVIKTSGSIIRIAPDGTTSQMSKVTVQTFAPPALSNNPDINKFLANTTSSLSGLLTALLQPDNQSVNNILAGDASLNTYQLINRRLYFLSELIK